MEKKLHSWKHAKERALKSKLYRAKILIKTSPEYISKYPNEARAAAKKDYTEQIIRVKKDYATYLKFTEVPNVERPKRVNRV